MKPSAESLRGVWLVLIAFAVLQAPFLHAPFRVDEPNLLAIAKQIAVAPLDPYGFEINWLGTAQPAWEVLRNPPLVPYWIAGWGSVFGWSEVSLHLSMIPWTMLALVGAGALARRTGMATWLGSALLGFSVAFFVSAPLLMPDVAALALSSIAILMALRGERFPTALAIAAAAAAPLAKYTAIAVIAPLLVIAIRRRSGGAFAAALSPIVSLLAWSVVSSAAYGSSHLLASAGAQGGLKLPVMAILVALGLAVLPPGLLAFAASRRAAIISVASGALAFLVLRFLTENSLGSALAGAAGVALTVMIIIGVATRMAAEPSVERLAALAWLAATVALAFTYQFVTSRYLLAAAPAAILLVGGPLRTRAAALLVAATAVVSLGVAWADVRQASIYPRIASSLVESSEETLWLAGHWGFQHYGRAAGALMLEIPRDERVKGGDRIILSEASFPEITADQLMDEYQARLLSRVDFDDSFLLRTQACGPTISFHGAGASSCANAFRVAIPWGFSDEPLDVIHQLVAGVKRAPKEAPE